MKKLLIFLLLIFTTSPLLAWTYTYSNGYWWYNGCAYTRYWNGCSYSYVAVPNYNSTSYSEDATEQIFAKIARDRELYSQQSLLAAQKHNQFLEKVQAMNLSQGIPQQRYANPYTTSSPFGVSPYATSADQGDAVYGHTAQTVTRLYADTDLNAWNEAFNRTVQNGQNWSGKSVEGIKEVLQQATDGSIRVQTIKAKQDLLKSLDVPEATSIKTETNWNKSSSLKGGNNSNNLAAVFEKDVVQNCAQCHNGNVKDRPDLSKLPSFNAEQRKQVLDAIDPQDGSAPRMPKDGDGRVHPLPLATRQLYRKVLEQ